MIHRSERKACLVLLREVIEERCPKLCSAVADETIKNLTEPQRRQIVDLLTDEFCQSGIREDGEPNERGKRLDNLIGYFVPYDLPVGWDWEKTQ